MLGRIVMSHLAVSISANYYIIILMVIAVHKNITHYLFEILFLLQNQLNHGKSESTIKYQIVIKINQIENLD